MPDQLSPGRQRRSPVARGGRPTLNADLIAAAMLELAGRDGFRAVTMQVLAEHLGVTVRALYRHVRDRQDVVDRAVELWLAKWPEPELDPGDWRASFAEYCRLRRETNRAHPRALLFSLDEQVGDVRLHPRRLTAPDAFLGFLTGLGLSMPDALFVHRDLTLRLYAFALLVDYRHDLGQPGVGDSPMPRRWLDRFPDLDVPHLREAMDVPRTDPDEMFDRMVDDIAHTITRLRER
ncbi:TetR/AcrR family transcriptional regulator [Nocardia sp. NPDC058480]|uniref:TetR/AcrR family transcriptional regulator n=1 Tax=unclassified Nocardia TaxID=2637762 RepID=UPI0036467A45